MSVAEDAGADLGQPSPGPHPDAVARSRFSVPPERRADVLIAALLASATFFVHDLGYVLTTPLWNDEFWVAISTKLPLHDLLRVIASSPPGWTLMLRMVPFGYPEGIRIVPLLFAALTVLAAYIYARTLPWPSLLLARIAGVLAGVAALLIPSSLARNDLKQYTADAFVALVALCLVSRVESNWNRPKWSWRLVELAAFLAVGFLFSTAAIMLGAASFGAVFLAALVRRDWHKLVPTALIGAACMACLLLTYLVVYRPGAPDGLTEYWANFYVPVAKGWAASWEFLVDAQERMVRWLGMGPFVLVAGLVVAGVTSLVMMRRFSSALVVPLLVVLMIALSAARRYPLFDTRTSHFLTVALAVTAAIGVAGLCALAARLHPAIAVTVAVVFTAAFIISPDVSGHLRWHSIPKEDLDTPTTFIANHLQPGDTIAVPMLSSWGFAYYWPHGEPAITPVTSNLQQFITVFPDQPNIVVATDGQPAGIDDVMTRAVALATGPDGNGRIWFPHEHIKPPELAGYQAWMESHGVKSTTAVPRTLDLLTVQASP